MAHPDTTTSTPARTAKTGLPKAPVDRLLAPLARFLHVEAGSGIVLLLCAALALGLSNSPVADSFQAIWKTPIGLTIGDWQLTESLGHWINDGLMTIFFFVVGLEIKRELVRGELRDPRTAALPAMAALGGMIVPASIYFAFQQGRPGEPGWGIPMATDIAFVVGFLALLGNRVPTSLKIFLLTLAIVDDIGAVLVIAVFYTAHVSLVALAVAAAGIAVTYGIHRLGVRQIPVYVVVGSLIWLAFLKSGVHPTVAGVLLGLMTPALAWIGDRTFTDVVSDFLQDIRDRDGSLGRDRNQMIGKVAWSARESVAPLERLETGLHPWVAYAIMPLFALANAGVPIEPSALGDPIAVAVAAGLVLGKPVGILAFSYLGVRSGLARLPEELNWRIVFGAGCLAGIGFTMSLFIAALALEGGMLDAGKIGILAGSALSAFLGSGLLWRTLKRPDASINRAE